MAIMNYIKESPLPHIAVATIDHRHGIADVAAEALGAKVVPDSPRVQHVLDAGCAFVALAEGRVVGFVSNFKTRDETGHGRFELDLLGVAPAWQGRGIGSALVERSMQAARCSNATTLRALVRCDNMPMQRICRRCGLQRLQSACQLLLSRAKGSASGCSPEMRARIIAVDTLTYSGYWLEGELSQCAIDAARQLLRAQPGRAQLGTVVPQSDRATIDLLRANSFEVSGDYDWWTLSL